MNKGNDNEYKIPFLIKNQIDDEFITNFMLEFYNLYEIKGNNEFNKCNKCSFFIAYNLKYYGLEQILYNTCKNISRNNIFKHYKKLIDSHKECFKLYLPSILVEQGYLDEIDNICNRCILI